MQSAIKQHTKTNPIKKDSFPFLPHRLLPLIPPALAGRTYPAQPVHTTSRNMYIYILLRATMAATRDKMFRMVCDKET